jgi:hypothetical protein
MKFYSKAHRAGPGWLELGREVNYQQEQNGSFKKNKN